MDEVQKTFREIAERYDRYRRKLIPCFDDFYRTVVDMVPFGPEETFRVLDLGAGTGLLSQFLHERFSKAQFTLIDFTAEMLAQAKRRFSAGGNFRYQVANYADEPWQGPYELIVSSLSIHHLDDPKKKRLYEKVRDNLVPGGAFLNAEFVRFASPELQAHYWKLWIQSMRDAGLNEGEVGEALGRTSIDILAPVELQTGWLQDLGFREVDCYYRSGLFAVFGGRKSQ